MSGISQMLLPRTKKQNWKLYHHPNQSPLDGKVLKKLFSDQQVDLLVHSIERDLAAALVQLNDQLPGFKEVEQMYLEAKAGVDAAQTVVDQHKELLQQLASYRNHLKATGDFRLLRQTSHASKPVKQPRAFKWIPMVVDALMKVNKFIDFDSLWQIMLQENPTLAASVQQDDKFRNKKLHVKRNVARPRSRHASIIIYKDKFGLPQWMDGTSPQPGYLKEFMYK